jgi:hypothetical protein
MGARRRSVLLVAAVVAACACLTAATATAGTTRHAASEIDVFYLGGALQVKFDGAVIRSGGSIPAGSYMVYIFDDEYATPQFSMTGPGVSLSTEMNSTQMGGLITPWPAGPFNFQSGGTYRVADSNLGAGAASTFTVTAAAGSSGSGGSNSPATSVSGSGSTKTGSSSNTLLGTLQGSISSSGKATLTLGGKAATKLRAGRYAVVVDDRSKKAGLVVGQASKKPITLSGAATTGKKTSSLTLTAGKWFVQSSPGGAKTYFTVT